LAEKKIKEISNAKSQQKMVRWTIRKMWLKQWSKDQKLGYIFMIPIQVVFRIYGF